jgi:hypothetical protein
MGFVRHEKAVTGMAFGGFFIFVGLAIVGLSFGRWVSR